ncbi:MAG: hypothetical protein JNL70_05005 [Saprospiraceae bacterium]|nr:hypothetical protein [Saprospiraceae bacterium]
MKNKIKILFVLLCFLANQHSFFAQKPNYTGVWKLNLTKSKLQSERSKYITDGVFTIKQEGDKFKLSRYFIVNGKKRKLKITLLANGKERRVKVFFKGKLEWKGTHLQASIWTKGFSNVVNYQFGSSPNEFIADEVYKSQSENYHNNWVFDKSDQK